MKAHSIRHEFVEFMPDQLEEGVLYVSMEYATAIHNCLCGCSNKVVTPISPTDWQLTYNGRAVSLRPSVGNWGFPCQSHYWIKNNQVEWSYQMSPSQIAAGRSRDRAAKDAYYHPAPAPAVRVQGQSTSPQPVATKPKVRRGFFHWLFGGE